MIFCHLIINSKETPLYQACNRGKLKIVKLLLEKGSSVNKQNDRKESPLSAACTENHSIVKLLVEKGAKLKIKNDSKETPLFKAAESDKIKIVKYLVSLKVDLNESNDDKILSITSYETPLFIACERDNFEIARFLINNGANVKKGNKNK